MHMMFLKYWDKILNQMNGKKNQKVKEDLWSKCETQKDGYGMRNLGDDMLYLTLPVVREEFETLKGIKEHYQFIPLKCGIVGMRKFGCFCKQCYINSLYNKPTSLSQFNLGGALLLQSIKGITFTINCLVLWQKE